MVVRVSVTAVFNPDAIPNLLSDPGGEWALLVGSIAQDIVSLAKQLAPVDTGRLRSSLTWQLAPTSVGIVALVGTNVEYAPHQEFGTRYMQAQPFLIPALISVSRSL